MNISFPCLFLISRFLLTSSSLRRSEQNNNEKRKKKKKYNFSSARVSLSAGISFVDCAQQHNANAQQKSLISNQKKNQASNASLIVCIRTYVFECEVRKGMSSFSFRCAPAPTPLFRSHCPLFCVFKCFRCKNKLSKDE